MDTSDNLRVVSNRELVSANNIAVALVEFAEAAALGAFAAEVAVDLGDLERKAQIIIMFDNVACERHSVIEAQSLVGAVGRLGGLAHHINLFFGITTGFCEEDLGAFDDRSFDIQEAVMVVYVADVLFELVKNGLLGW